MFFRLFFRVKVIGKENVPKSESVLLCSNHISNLDPPFVGGFAPRPVHYMAKAELFENRLLNWLLPKLGAFPIKRGSSDRQALRTGLGHLKEGHVVGVFPEGTRSKTGELGQGLAGVGFFALRSKAHVVPCAVIGRYRPFSKLTIVYGEPLNFNAVRERKASAEEATEEIMKGIQQLLNTYR
ncbi:1-acyl-sn-glycerol-3-phosphate acyltransferase [Texcoconibacillus texcoconensis]|uniref:1-acyl-sn-glycerol-3-phosphate acyltransferase n=1 Tax=Texcoconibacillus texcoconensis TaxID=1095777 RepID=A0A840QNJ5_9BACI|nr:lysophospholipid acyltransferase family protein [Texcoconibacillus texcoconensis]MBB5172911.1 1-acyl-sn-glycerol-3-phosphate acyltransferase [Texcoconibacillus texcoconensis]